MVRGRIAVVLCLLFAWGAGFARPRDPRGSRMEPPAKRVKGAAAASAALFAEVATALEAYFDGLHSGKVERLREVWHEEGHLYGLAPDGSLVDRSAAEFFKAVAAREPSQHLAEHDAIIRLDFASPRCCAAKVQIALSAAKNSPTPSFTDVLYTDFLVLLRLGGRWQIISKVFASVPLSEPSYEEPYDALAYSVAEPVRGVQDYFRGGHLGCPEILGQNFHANARLCFSNEEEKLVRWSQAEFFEVLKSRAPTATDTRALRFDKILGVDKAGPDVALIKLQIGYPPQLYTDFLSMLRISGRWWIIAKSSDSKPFKL
ncbi:unnamed protein product [Effrenium voratum]|uniref:Nuclear transport factor 2 family protein n=1 Tax=Effrenium voratum TaxID=2562239 RepID=A0AA36IBT8_9DINO|nr:unnamed protein product [Effrenium voratum]CAJ1384838.1 unnamed protein product [Effrenium voratum]